MNDRTGPSSAVTGQRRVRRRTVLGATAAGLGLLAGCADGGSDGSDGDDGDDGGGGYGGGSDGSDGDDTDDGGDGDGAGTTGDDATPSGDLDLREANVTGVEVESEGDGEYRFSVTLYHDVRKSHAIFAAHQKSTGLLRTTTARTGTPTGGSSNAATGRRSVAAS